MELEQTNCYLCGSDRSNPWGEERGYAMVQCSDCGFVYLNPRPPLAAIDEAAKTGMHKTAAGSMIAVGAYSRARVEDYKRKIVQLIPEMERMSEPVRWLDIGAGYGELLQALASVTVPGSELIGIEPCEPKVQKARRLGLRVETRAISAIEGPFSHLSLINVFSHLPNPIEFLAELKPLLRPNGSLILVTGNAADIRRDEFPGSLYLPDHLSFAGERHLREIMDRAGYTVVALDKHVAGASIDGPVVGAFKNMARWCLGRATVPLTVPSGSKFRSLWIWARVNGPHY